MRGIELCVGLALASYGLLVPITIAGANITWGVVTAAVVLLWWPKKPLPWPALRGPLLAPLAAFVAAALLSCIFGADPSRSFHAFNREYHKLWIYTLLTLSLAVGETSFLTGGLALGLGAAAVLGIGQVLRLPRLTADGTLLRAHAFVHPVTYGAQMAFAVLGSAAFLLRGGHKAWLTLAVAAAAALWLSDTRAAMAALAVGLAAVLLALPRLRRWAWAPAAVAVLALPFAARTARYSRGLIEEVRMLRTGDSLPLKGPLMRLALWKAAWRIGLDHPLTGVGLSGFPVVLPRYVTGEFEGGARTWGSVNNWYLQQFAEQGLPGVAALAWLLYVLLARAWERARAKPNAWTLWALGVAAATPVLNLTETSFSTELVWMLTLLIWLRAEQAYARD